MARCECPYCGSTIQVGLKRSDQIRVLSNGNAASATQFETSLPTSRVVYRRGRKTIVRPYEASVPQGVDTAYQDEMLTRRETPARAPNVESDIKVPLLRSIIWTGGVFIASFVLIVGLAGWEWYWVPLFTSPLVWLVFWAIETNRLDALLSVIEEFANVDINNDGRIGGREPEEFRMKLDVTDTNNNGDKVLTVIDLPSVSSDADYNRLMDFAYDVYHKRKGMGRDAWTSGAEAPFTKPQYHSLIDDLTDNGLIRYANPKSPKQGRVLTKKGERVFSELADQRTKIHGYDEAPQGSYGDWSHVD